MKVNLRKFPYPYKSAFAFSCDCDAMDSLDIFLIFMKYINTNKNTPLGQGLNLEFGSSFWFYNDTGSAELSYYKDKTENESPFASICRELWKSGHIDTLHSYGNFSKGQFARKYAEKAINELEKYNVKIKSWVNHGKQDQNIGVLEGCYGAFPEHNSYHFDLTTTYGVKYACTRYLTHIIGQNAKWTLNVRFMTFLQRLVKLTKYRHFKHDIYDLKNRLMLTTQLQDDNRIGDFHRYINKWGGKKPHNLFDLLHQIHPNTINRLIKNRGFLILYTHLFEEFENVQLFSGQVRKNFEYLAKRYHAGDVLVTTTTRMLEYYEISQSIRYRISEKNGKYCIHIEPYYYSLGQKKELGPSDLQGLTFYCEQPDCVEISLNCNKLTSHINPPDEYGKCSCSIPWYRLEYPL